MILETFFVKKIFPIYPKYFYRKIPYLLFDFIIIIFIFVFGIEVWCNGSTTDFGSVGPGPNPGISTKQK